MGTVEALHPIDKHKVKIGDMMVLRSGGPGMTVRSITKQPRSSWIITCDWFNESEHAQADFLSDQLIPWGGEDDEGEPEQDGE